MSDTIKVYKDEKYDQLVQIAYIFKYGKLQSYSVIFDTNELYFPDIKTLYSSIKEQVEQENNIKLEEKYIWKYGNSEDYEKAIIDGILRIESKAELASSNITIRIHGNNGKIMLVLLNDSKIGKK